MSGTGKMIAFAKAFGVTESAISQEVGRQLPGEVDSWLDEHITNPDSPPLDRSLSSSSSAAPADMVGGLKSAITDITGNSYYTYTKDKSVNKSAPTTQTTESNWESCVVSCSAGDVFNVIGYGGNNTQLWMFSDSNGTLLTSSGTGVHSPEFVEIVAPIGAAYLAVNSNYSQYHGKLVYNTFLRKEDDTLHSAINATNSALRDLGANGDIFVPATFNWQNGHITDNGEVATSTASQYAIMTLTAGQTITVGTRNTYTTVISSTESDSLSVGDFVTIIYKTGGTDEYVEYSYTAKETIKIVACVRKSEFNVHVKEPSMIKTVSERVDNLEDGVEPITKTLTWSSGWIGTNGKINSSTASQFALVQLNRGETVKVGTANSSTCIIGWDTRSSVSVGDTISTIITTSSGDTGYLEHTYTAQDTINVVICVNKNNYDVNFYKQSDLGICEEKILDLLNITDKNYYEETAVENGGFGASGLTYGNSNRIRTVLIAFSARTRIFIKNGSLQHACGMWQDVVDSAHIKRNDNSFNTKDESFVTAYSGYLVVVFRNSSNTSLSPNDYDGTIKVYKPSFSNLEGVLNRLNSARHIPRNAGVPLTILHISDIHNSPIALNQIVKQAEYYDDKINEMICTGDLVSNTYTSITSWWNEKVLTCIGNHDTAGYVDGDFSWTALSMANRDAYYIAPFESNWNITHTSGTSYYYKDYTDSKVRLIVMDAMLYNDNGSEATTQTAWLADLLADAITNELHVIIAIHSPHGGAKAVSCSFTELGETDMPTLSDCNTPQSVIDTVATAINNGLHFIGYICGHTHRDTIWDAEDDGRQLMFAIICAMNSPANTDLYRGPNNNAYNLVTIDTVNTLVKIVRGGGADIDNAMRPREAICFNYSTGQKIGEIT